MLHMVPKIGTVPKLFFYGPLSRVGARRVRQADPAHHVGVARGAARRSPTRRTWPRAVEWSTCRACSIRLAVKKLVMIRWVITIGSVGVPNGCGLRPKSIINSSGVPVTRQKLAYNGIAFESSM